MRSYWLWCVYYAARMINFIMYTFFFLSNYSNKKYCYNLLFMHLANVVISLLGV